MTQLPPDDPFVRAVRDAETRRRAAVPVPPAEHMLALVRSSGGRPDAARCGPLSAADAARLAGRIAVAQLRLIHPMVVPVLVTLLGLSSVAIGMSSAPVDAAARLHAVLVLACVAVACVIATPGDVRREYLFVTPVSPSAVLAARLTIVLGGTILVAAACSVVLTFIGSIAADPFGAVLAWLGPALFIAGSVTWAGVWRGTRSAVIVSVLALFVIVPVSLGQFAFISPLISGLLGVLLLVAAIKSAGRGAASVAFS
ncbi:hypothetical protein [Austwickia chelonae]|uniref:hypothetical protein n=1 Tax=Austwickia chelonae TaxID=100225 RepID=UPI000E26313F|nr:hypothetical protein [Austwickia chelonae]